MALPKLFRVDPIWKGATVAIVGGGPSLSLKQVRLIAKAKMCPNSNVRVMAVNDAIYPCWFADWHHACDWSWWVEHIQNVHTFPGIKTTLAEDVPEPWVTGYLHNTGSDGFDPDPTCCRTGANSVYQGMHIALHAGVKKIVLVGVDMKNSADGEAHWFGDHRDGRRANFAGEIIPKFAGLLPAIKERGVEVINASPGSALEIFPHMDLAAALQ